MPVGHRDLLAFLRFLTCKLAWSVKALHALVVDNLTRLAQLQIDHVGALTSMPLRQSNDLLLERTVGVLGRLVAVGTGAHAHDA